MKMCNGKPIRADRIVKSEPKRNHWQYGEPMQEPIGKAAAYLAATVRIRERMGINEGQQQKL